MAKPNPTSTRRQWLGSALGAGTWVLLADTAKAANGELAAAISRYTGGETVLRGRVKLDIAELVDNGNVVPITITVDSPMLLDNYVKSVAVFNEKNPQRDVVKFTFSPRSGKAAVTTRIRLANSQKLVAVAQLSDGSFWSHTVDVIVTLAACIEGAT